MSKVKREDRPGPNMFTLIMMEKYPIGRNIRKLKTFEESFSNASPVTASQMFFLAHEKPDKVLYYDDENIKKGREMIMERGLNIYIHCSYNLNICDSKRYITDCIKRQLTYAKRLYTKGVVLHVGKHCCVNSIEEGMRNCVKTILECLDSASVNCPLLLETPASQGTETLTDMNDFLNFIDSIDDERFGMCLDSCHVFASGYQPTEYLQKIIDRGMLNRLKLVHLNDSCDPLGSRKDRHSFIGTGHIELEEIHKFIHMCYENGLDMVIE